MRIGRRPEQENKITYQSYHKIIVPIYVPNLEGYFKDGLRITQLCIESLILTKHEKAVLVVINNNSCKEVVEFLQKKFEDGGIDSLLHHKRNLGKIDAVIPIAKSSQEELITITDGDVLFEPGWMQAVEEIFNVFPEAGMVSPVPNGIAFTKYTSNSILGGLLFGKLKIVKGLCDPKAMLSFAESIGAKDKMYKKKLRLSHQMVVRRKEILAVVGCGHFVSTMRKGILYFAPNEASGSAYSEYADRVYIDEPLEKSGLWRLATKDNLAWHMGNVCETWMENRLKQNKHVLNVPKFIELKKSKPTTFGIPLMFRKFLVYRILFSDRIRPYFIKILGLNATANEY